MATKYKFYVCILSFLYVHIQIAAQEKVIWTKENALLQKSQLFDLTNKTLPKEYTVFDLNNTAFQEVLFSSKGIIKNTSKPKTVYFPNKNGNLEPFQVIETSVMEESLQKKFPNLKSYRGKSLINASTTIYFTSSPYGINAVIYNEGESPIYIDPVKDKYIMYRAKNSYRDKEFTCNVMGSNTEYQTPNLHQKPNNDNKLRVFRLAIVATGQYSQYHLNLHSISSSASDIVKKEVVISAIQNAITRVNSVYERDLSIRLILVDNNENIVFLNPQTDNLTNDNGVALISEGETIINNTIGVSNYDIGHVFSTEGGGLAMMESVCTENKAQGVTGSNHPIGDPYHIDYVCHEIGHQFGATHIFNGSAGFCKNNRFNPTAVEPGSGSTIMGYAGICDYENIQVNSDAYFHNVSIYQITNYVKDLSCPTIINTGNSAPIVSELPNYTLPISTPFALNATATDADNDNLTYTWEQLDTKIVSIPLVSTNTGGPAFRSVMPSSNSIRYFPNTITVSNNLLKNEWEVLPSVSRTMQFVVTVRDNHINGGRTSSQETTLTFNENAGPFTVTSQENTTSWAGGSLQTITWNVSNTDKSPINCELINILFSEDGGNTFSHTLATDMPNNGSAVIFAPNVDTSEGRIKIESVGNVFYSINKETINVTKQTPIDVDFIVQAKDQTCPTQQDGSITIIAQVEAGFSTKINGKSYSFRKNIVIDNLASGTYDFCINAEGVNEKCFQKIILKGNELKVESTLNYPKNTFTITEGTAPFYVTINGSQVLKTSENSFEIDVKNGDEVQIKTDITCEGIYKKTIIEFEDIRAFPNPTSGLFEISVPKTNLQKVAVGIFSTLGQLISKKEYPVSFKRIAMNINHLPTGVYFIEVYAEEKKVIKLVKQ